MQMDLQIKYHDDGTVERYKVWLIAKGLIQHESVDYKDTFTPIAKLIIVHYLLAVAAIWNWPLH